MLPRFRRTRGGDLVYYRKEEAEKGLVSSPNVRPSELPSQVKANALRAVRFHGGDVKNEKHVFGQYVVQFGKYRGQTFLWMVENCLGYSGWLVDAMRRETITQAPLSQNKHAFKDYLLSFAEGREVVDSKKEQRVKEEEKKKEASLPPQVLFANLPAAEARRLQRERAAKSRPAIKPTIPKQSPKKHEMSDEALLGEVEKLEDMLLQDSPAPKSHTVSRDSDLHVDSPAPLVSVKETEFLKTSGLPSTSEPVASQTLSLQSESSQAVVSKRSPSKYVLSKPQKTMLSKSEKSDSVVSKSKSVVSKSKNSESVVAESVLSMPEVSKSVVAESVVSMPEVSEAEVAEPVPSESLTPPETSKRIFTPYLKTAVQDYPIIESWKASLPSEDIPWISKALFSYNAKGKAELDDRKIDRLWYEPPQPPLVPIQKPKPERYFGHRLLMWMPLRMFKVQLKCPNCKKTELTKQGPYRNTRLVLDVDGYYILAAEYLHCSLCKKNQISWNQCILDQLDPSTRSKFPVHVLYKTACDQRVIFMMHQRGLGNSPTQLQKQISELHNSVWASKMVQYLQDCKIFAAAGRSGLVTPCNVDEPPKQLTVPTYQWFIDVYCQEVTGRLCEVKAAITSIFGRVLKMDSTKKVTKKLAGQAARTASWAANISNEFGQVLQSVMTSGEGVGLEPMVAGIVRRYREAEVPPPVLLYVDSHCCGASKLMDIFRDAWPDLALRLDVWHFMRRLAVGVTTDTHRLYGTFMGQLSHAIFKWDKDDLSLLKAAKRSEMISNNINDPTETDIINRLTRKEMASHCRRTTRGAEETISMIQMLLEMFDGEQGRDTMGVPLFHHERIWEIWRVQKNHVICLQDPDGVQLYTQTGTLKKGNISLPVFRCARGSTSLESFHLHLQHFIPGTSASANNFQVYLLEGLHRWNEDRMAAAIDAHPDPVCYSATLKHTVNNLGQEMLGRKFFPNYVDPRKYTGELIGIDYLFSQTGKSLEEVMLDRDAEEDTATEGEEKASDTLDEGFAEEEEFEDLTVNIVDSFLPTQQSRSSDTSSSQQTSPPGVKISSGIESSTQDEAVGPDNVGGYQHVVALVEYLYRLREKQPPVITNAEADIIISLWNKLTPFDQAPSKFKDHFKQQLIKGRFKAPKSTRVDIVPGVQSVKRCALAPHLGPAAWPDTNRYQEAFISRLCLAFPSSTSKDGKRQPRWKAVIDAYNRVRDMIFSNGKILAETNIQLPDVNQKTLTAWFSARGKRREKETLEQGLKIQGAPSVAAQSLPPAVKKPDNLQTGTAAPHGFTLVDSTVGKSKKGRRRIFPVQPKILAEPVPILPRIPTWQPSMNTSPEAPYSTIHYHKKKLQAAQMGEFKRSYIRKATVTSCGKCGEDKSGGGHQQYYGNIYCPTKSGVPYEEWKAGFKDKGYGKRKAKKDQKDSEPSQKRPKDDQ